MRKCTLYRAETKSRLVTPILAAALLVSGTVRPDAAETAADTKRICILTVGNSFARNAARYLVPIADSAPGCKAEFTSANIGGASLELHARNTEKSGANPDVKPYMGSTLKERLKQHRYAVVTML